LQTLTSGIQLSVRAAAGAGLSLAVAAFLKLDYPIYAFIAAVICTDLSPTQTRLLGLRRIAATIIGAVWGAALSSVLPHDAWSVALSVLIAMLTSYFLYARDGARVAGYICGIVVFVHSDEPWSYALYRFVETALGVVIAWLISCIPKLMHTDEPTS
jgi:uncharacterized membrane protein YgaE (UPF0421/DUF939 family)